MGFYQDPEANYSTFMGTGSAVDSVYRQHSHTGRAQRGVREPGMHELHNQLEKVNHKPSTDSGVPRSDSGHSVHGAEIPIGQVEKDLCGVTQTSKRQTTSASSLACLLGKMNATTHVIPPPPLFCRHLQMILTRAMEEGSQSYKTLVTLPQRGERN